MKQIININTMYLEQIHELNRILANGYDIFKYEIINESQILFILEYKETLPITIVSVTDMIKNKEVKK